MSAADPVALIRIRLDPIYTQLTEKHGISFSDGNREIIPFRAFEYLFRIRRGSMKIGHARFRNRSTFVVFVSTIHLSRRWVPFRIEDGSISFTRRGRRWGALWIILRVCKRRNHHGRVSNSEMRQSTLFN